MKIEVSNGELIDKITILEIKLNKITIPNKREHVQKELNTIRPLAEELIEKVSEKYDQLKLVNLQLWDIEDRIREFEKDNRFDNEFVQAARSVYRLNDFRAEIKFRINDLTGSDLVEQKSYESY